MKTIKYEDLSDAAKKGLDEFRSFIAKSDLEGYINRSVGIDLLILRPSGGQRGQHISPHSMVFGFLFSAGASLMEANDAVNIAEQKNFWLTNVHS